MYILPSEPWDLVSRTLVLCTPNPIQLDFRLSYLYLHTTTVTSHIILTAILAAGTDVLAIPVVSMGGTLPPPSECWIIERSQNSGMFRDMLGPFLFARSQACIFLDVSHHKSGAEGLMDWRTDDSFGQFKLLMLWRLLAAWKERRWRVDESSNDE